MKRLVYQILIIAMLLSSIGLMPVLASDSQDAIDYVVTEGLWTAGGDFGADQAATRAQTASVMARYLSELRPPYAGNFSDVDATGIYASDITLATNLGLVSGSNGAFRPDDAITREEFAVMLTRAYEIAGHEIFDTKYATELIIDYDSISDWAKKSVTDALGNGFMISGEKKKFNPAGTVTRAELAAAVYALKYADEDGLTYTEKIVSNPDLSGYNKIYNVGLDTRRGIGGVGVLALYAEAGPKEFYVKRDKVDFVSDQGSGGNNMGDTVCFAKVTDPNGNTVCRVDMDWLEYGVMEKIITIPDGPAGLYQIQFSNGNVNNNLNPATYGFGYDRFSVGLKGAQHWGIRGEDNIKRLAGDDSVPMTGYIYVPNKVDYLTMGVVGTRLKLYTEDGGTQILYTTTAKDSPKYDVTVYANPAKNPEGQVAVTGDTVYKYVLENNDYAVIGISGISPVLYDTADAARAIKSGYIQHTDEYADFQLAGPLQKRARERMVEIYNEMKAAGNEKFAVDISDKRPASSVTQADLDNPLAEAMLFGPYGGSVSYLNMTIDTQCIDPSNPWFGLVISRNTVPYDSDGDGEADMNVHPAWNGELQPEDYPYYEENSPTERSWQTGHYSTPIDTRQSFSGAVSINGELNAFYNHPTVLKRAELYLLYFVTSMSSDGMFVYGYNEKVAVSGEKHTNEQFFFGDNGLAQAYYYLRPFLSPETRQITDAGILNNNDRIMNYRGQGVSNQLFMAYSGTIWTYCWSGIEFYHKQTKNNVLGVIHPTSYIGQSQIGFFYEGFGTDGISHGGYGGMCAGIFAEMAYAYLSLPESRQDPEFKAQIIDSLERSLIWDSYFFAPSTENFTATHARNWSTRTDSGGGTYGTNGGEPYYMHIFPRAKKNMIVAKLGKDYDTYKTTTETAGNTKHLLSDAAAIKSLNGWGALPRYEKYYYLPVTSCNIPDCNILHYDGKGLGHGGRPDSYRPGNSLSYYVRHQDDWFEEEDMPQLPYEYEGDYNVDMSLDENNKGIVALKHKGMYMILYFNHGFGFDKYNYFSQWSWLGGGPTEIWDEYFATTLSSMKPNNFKDFVNKADNGGGPHSNYTVVGFDIDDIKHSCILGTDANGRIFISGRECSVFSWEEQGKSFKLSGQQIIKNAAKEVIQDKTITWIYTMTDKGFCIDGGVERLENGEELYMQLPIIAKKGATFLFDEANHQIVIEHNGNKMVYRWKAGADVHLGAASTDTADADNFKYLRIKLTAAEPLATVWVEKTVAAE